MYSIRKTIGEVTKPFDRLKTFLRVKNSGLVDEEKSPKFYHGHFKFYTDIRRFYLIQFAQTTLSTDNIFVSNKWLEGNQNILTSLKSILIKTTT